MLRPYASIASRTRGGVRASERLYCLGWRWTCPRSLSGVNRRESVEPKRSVNKTGCLYDNPRLPCYRFASRYERRPLVAVQSQSSLPVERIIMVGRNTVVAFRRTQWLNGVVPSVIGRCANDPASSVQFAVDFAGILEGRPSCPRKRAQRPARPNLSNCLGVCRT